MLEPKTFIGDGIAVTSREFDTSARARTMPLASELRASLDQDDARCHGRERPPQR